MNIKLCHRLTPYVNVLYLLRGDVLALRQLEDVLLSVNDFQRPVLQQIQINDTKKQASLTANAA